MTVTKIY